MLKKSLGECMIVDWSEVPCKADLEESVKRLRKDAELMSRIRGKTDTGTTENFNNVANFLESVLKRGEKTLTAT